MFNKNNLKSLIFYAIFALAICIISGSCAKKTPKVYRIGIISGAEAFFEIADGFKAKMTELGYIEGRNVIYDIQKLNFDSAVEQQVAKKFVTDKVDLIFAFPSEPAVAAKAAANGTDIPVVFALTGIEGNNMVENITRPGGNITGVRFPGPEITAERLEILHELVPLAKRVYLVYDPNYPTAPTALESLNKLAPLIGIELIKDKAGNLEELRSVLKARAALKDIDIDAIFVMPEILTQSPEGWAEIIRFAREHKLPVSGATNYTVQNGALFGASPDNIEMGELSALMADKIFKGTPAGEIMVVTPHIRLVLNCKVAKELGLSISEGLLSTADEIIR